MKFNIIFSFFSQNKKKIVGVYGKTADGNFLMSLLPLIWVTIFFVLPFFIVLKISFSEAKLSIPPFTETFNWVQDASMHLYFYFGNYIKLIRDSYYREAFLNSILLASSATLFCLLIGYMIAYGISKMPNRVKPVLLLLVSLSFWTSFLIRIYAWINLFSAYGVVNSILLKMGIVSAPVQFLGNYCALCVGMVFCYLPFMIFPIYSVLEKLEISYLEAAFDLGSSPWRTFWRITVPLSKNGITAGCLLVFAASVGEFVIPELLGGPDSITVGRILWLEFFNNIDWPMACAMSIVMLIFIILPVFIFQKNDTIVSSR